MYPPDSPVWELTRRKIATRINHHWWDSEQLERRKPHPNTRHVRNHVLGRRVYLTPAEEKAHYMKMMDIWKQKHSGRKQRKKKGLRFTREPKANCRFNTGATEITYPWPERKKIEYDQKVKDVIEIGMNALDVHMIRDVAKLVIEYVGGPRQDKGTCLGCSIAEMQCPGTPKETLIGAPHGRRWTCDLGHTNCTGDHWLPHSSNVGHFDHPK